MADSRFCSDLNPIIFLTTIIKKKEKKKEEEIWGESVRGIRLSGAAATSSSSTNGFGKPN